MAESTFTFSDLTRFLKGAPRIRSYLVPTTLFVVVDFILVRNLWFTVFAFIFPLGLTISLDVVFVRLSDYHFPIRRTNYLNFLSFYLSDAYFIVVRILSPDFLSVFALVMLSFSTSSFLRVLVLYTYFSEKFKKIFVPSLFYSFSVMVGLVFLSPPVLSYAYFALASVIFSVGAYVFIEHTMKGFRYEFGHSPVSILNYFLNSRSARLTDDEARSFLRKLYNKKKVVPIQVIDVEGRSGKRKVTLVFPYVHPGPFGTIGTSNLPEKLHNRLAGSLGDLMVFHTATTNSDNSVFEEDIDTIASSVEEAARNAQKVGHISRLKKLNVGKYSIGLIRMDDYGWCTVFPDRERFDDISYEEGIRLIKAMRDSGSADFILTDAQSNFLQGAPLLEDLSPLIPACRREFNRLTPRFRPRIGYARKVVKYSALGPMGIQVMVIQVNRKKQALILTDSNNITDELMEATRNKILGIVDEVFFLTTDNHYVNAGTLDMNPLGQRDDPGIVSESIRECVADAVDNIEECVIRIGSSRATVRGGEGSLFKRMLSVVSSSVRGAKYYITLTISVCLSSTILISFFFGAFFGLK